MVSIDNSMPTNRTNINSLLEKTTCAMSSLYVRLRATEPQDSERVAKSVARQRLLKSIQLAQSELKLGVTENRGENDSINIEKYRGGNNNEIRHAPWCASFVNYVTSVSLGLGNLFDLDRNYSSKKRNWMNASLASAIKKAAQNNDIYKDMTKMNNHYKPKPGDLIVWDGHIGIVETVNINGSFTTIEGNTDNALKRRTYASVKDAKHPKSNNGEYSKTNLCGFIDMETYYIKQYSGELKTGKLDRQG